MKTIFGTMNIGQQVFGDEAVAMLGSFKKSGGVELDTAYVYNDGACEAILGKCLKQFDRGAFSIATKANPRVTGSLDGASVVSQINGSLERMGVDSVDIFYLHFPDASTPIEDAIEACSELYAEGKFKELGVSNFPLSLITKMNSICDDVSCPRPTVFEGVYNALSRRAEGELIPALREMGMRFYAYNPLAGGLLTGKYSNIEKQPSEGRFSLRAKSYQGRYWKESFFKAVSIITEACETAGIPDAEAALRWLAYHSMLDDDCGDGIIIGASKLSQLEQNLSSLNAGPLPQEIVEAMNHAWQLTKADAPEYFRFYKNGEAVG